MLSGSLDDVGGAESVDIYFDYRESGGSRWTAISKQTLSSTGSFSEDITGLTGDPDYEFRAAAMASDGDTDTGSALTVTTQHSIHDTDPV